MVKELDVLRCTLSICSLAFVQGQNIISNVNHGGIKIGVHDNRKKRNGRPFSYQIGNRSTPNFLSRQQPNLLDTVVEHAETVEETEADNEVNQQGDRKLVVKSPDFNDGAFWETYLGARVNSMPLEKPSEKPTVKPTSKTTGNPSAKPTSPPNPPPTYRPTPIPNSLPSPSPQTAQTGVPTMAPAPAVLPTEAPACQSIAEIACTTPGFEILCSLVVQADLVEPFTNDLLTVFAPTDEAFAKLPPELVAAVTADVKLLRDVLFYHAVPNQEVFEKDLICDGGPLDKLTMANLEDTNILCSSSVTPDSSVPDTSTFIEGNGNTSPFPMIVAGDIIACNGVIHVIDGVLIPGFPVDPTEAPMITPSQAPIAPVTPIIPTAAPEMPPTSAPVSPITPTDPPEDPTAAPVAPPTPASVTPITIPPTDPPVDPTAAPVPPPTPSPVSPITPTNPPVDPTAAPAVPPTPAPIAPLTAAPIAPTVAPVAPTEAPMAGPSVVLQAIQPVALQGGAEFQDPNSYQSQALARTEEQEGIETQPASKIIQYYALYAIFAATNGVSNVITDSEGIPDPPGWIVSSGWDQTNVDPCAGWFGVSCEGDQVNEIDLFSNLLTGAFPPEITLLASDGERSTGAGQLSRIDLFDNMLLTNNGDNSWWSLLGSSFGFLFFKNTAFSGSLARLPDNIQEFDCSFSFISGGLNDANFQGLNNLVFANFDGNAYNSTVPSSFSNLPKLEFLYIVDGFISGDLSYMVGMPVMREHWVDTNPGLGGQLPPAISTVTTLESFSITSCSFTGTIPSEFGNFGVTMKQIWMYDNQLSGNIPSELANMAALRLLQLEGNTFTGSMPVEICANTIFPKPLEVLGADCFDPNFSCDCCTCCSVEECPI